MASSKFKLFIHSVLFASLLLGLVKILSSMDGLSLRLELAGFFFLAILVALGFIGYAKNWGENLFFFVYVFYLANLVFLWHFSGLFYFVLIILALFGFILSIPQKKVPKKIPKVEVIPQTTPPEPKKEELEKNETVFSPGKYLASVRSNMYHEPKCEWAAKIKAKKLWFADKKEAESKNYKAHNCVGK